MLLWEAKKKKVDSGRPAVSTARHGCSEGHGFEAVQTDRLLTQQRQREEREARA